MFKEITIETSKHNDIVDINSEVESIVKDSNVKDGICNIFTPHATAAIIINENDDPNVGVDLLNSLNELIKEGKWLHDQVDNNGAAHIKASILGPSESIPIKNEKLALGTWQNIMLIDFDGPRERKVYVNIVTNKL